MSERQPTSSVDKSLGASGAAPSARRSLIWQVSPDLLGTVNLEGYFETANPAWMTVLGWTEAEVTSVSLFELIHPDDVERTRTQSNLTQQGKPAIKFTNRYRRKDGAYRWISWVGAFEDGVIFCSGRDITAEVEQAEQLAAARRERDTAWAVSQDLMVAVARDGTFTSVNTSWSRLLGWTEAELLGRIFTELTHPDDLENALGVFGKVSLVPLSTPFEHRLRHKDGSYRWFAWTAALAGELIYGNGRDTTAERENAAAMQAAKDALRDSLAFLAGTGDVARTMRKIDWSVSPLGHPRQWPQSLRSVVNLVLGSALPMFVAWGPKLITIYNDAYATLCGDRYPAALGQPFLETWPEFRAALQPLVARALAGESIFMENMPLRLRRNGFDEDTWFTFSYSPLTQENGQIAGISCACIETTQVMLVQQKLLAREQWLLSLFHQAPGFAIVLRGPDHRFEMVNQAYLDMTGNRQLLGQTVAHAMPEAFEQGFGGWMDGVFNTGEPFVGRAVPATINLGPGKAPYEAIVDFMFQPLRNAQGVIEGIFVQGHDVTEQHRAQQVLQAFSDSIPAIAWVATPDGRVERFNAQWYDYTGTSQEQAVGGGWVKRVHPDDLSKARAVWEGARRGHEAWQAECRLRRQDGVYRWFLIRAVPQLESSGVVTRWFGTTIDIDDATHAEKERRLLASIVENSPDFIGISDTDGNPIYGNRSAMELVGVQDLEQVRRTKISDYFIAEQRQFVEEVVLPAVAREGRWTGELTMQHFVTGATFPVHYDLFRVDDRVTGQPINFATISRDITERKRIERKLIEATTVAEKANRTKSDFLSSMSHELRTPLNSVLGFAQLLESGNPAPTPTQSQKIGHIIKGGWYLLDLVNDLLDLSQIESGKLALTQESVSLTEVMRECRDMIEPQARERGISITFPSLEPPGCAHADRTRVKQVVINLLSNAIKYNKAQGAIYVEFAFRQPDAIRVSVRDTGEGLAPEQLAQLFQPFNRLGKEVGPEQGTGIGLVMCKRLVELMGGTMGAESAVGVGSVFWFELNLVSAWQAAP